MRQISDQIMPTVRLYYYRLFVGLSALLAAAVINSPAAWANELIVLPAPEQTALREGRVFLTGDRGQYTGRILVTAPMDTVWKVLTDYDNFERFFPNVEASQLLESNGNQKVFEQVNVIRAFIFDRKARVRIATTETYPQHITFHLVDGDLKSLEGDWQLEPVSPNQVLITHHINVDPGSDFRDLFFSLYEESLENTLKALKQEIEKRAVN